MPRDTVESPYVIAKYDPFDLNERECDSSNVPYCEQLIWLFELTWCDLTHSDGDDAVAACLQNGLSLPMIHRSEEPVSTSTVTFCWFEPTPSSSE